MDAELLKECDLARDELKISTYAEAFSRISASPTLKLESNGWSLRFSGVKLGFLMEKVVAGKLKSIPTCPIHACSDYTLGLHFCSDHGKEYKKASTDGMIACFGTTEMIKTVVDEMSRIHKCRYGWTLDPVESDELYAKIALNPFVSNDVRVTIEAGSHSFRFSSANNEIYGCADKSGCYCIGIHRDGLDFYCSTHYKDEPKASSSKPSADAIRKGMLACMDFLLKKVNKTDVLACGELMIGNGSLEEMAIADAERQEAFRQWANFLSKVHEKPAEMVRQHNGIPYSFLFNKGLLCYKTDTKKCYPMCIYPRCGNSTGSALVSGKVVCTSSDHKIFANELIAFMPEDHQKLAKGKL